MDPINTLEIDGLIALISAIAVTLGFFFSGEPNRALKRWIVALGTSAALLFVLLFQYAVAPSSSILTFLGYPFPQSSLKVCHTSWKQLLSFTSLQSSVYSYPQFAGTTGNQSTPLTVDGSTVLAPLFQDAQKEFTTANPTVAITIHPLNSYQGLTDVQNGQANIGLADFFLNEAPRYDPSLPPVYSYSNLDDFLIAVAPYTLIVSQDLATTVQNLTTEAVREIYNGEMTNWRSVGGPAEPISVFNRTVGSGTRINFEQLIGKPTTSTGENIDETRDLVHDIATTNGAIGYASLSGILSLPLDQRASVAPVCLDGNAARTTDITSGKYKFWGYEHAFVKTSARNLPNIGRAFLWDICFGDFQIRDVLHNGFYPITQVPDTILASRYPDIPQVQDCGSKMFAEIGANTPFL